MTEEASGAPGPELLGEGLFYFYATPEGGRVITYIERDLSGIDLAESPEPKFVAIPPELTAVLPHLAANPELLMQMSRGPAGKMARTMAKRMMRATDDEGTAAAGG